jgi:ketosteroid isomerase-like protein
MISSERAAYEFLCAIDAGDIDRISTLLSPDVCLRFGNEEPVHGLADASARIAGLLSTVSTLSHELCETWVRTDAVICEVEITYERRDGSVITLPCVDVFRLSNGLIADYRAYMDINPLFTAATCATNR